MFRKLLLTALIATGTLAGLNVTAGSADAAPVEFRHCRYEVLVQCGPRWEVRSIYHNKYEAERAARHLRHEGFRVQIREC